MCSIKPFMECGFCRARPTANVIEIIDPGQKAAPPVTSLEQMGLLDEQNRLHGDEAGADARTLGGPGQPWRDRQTQRGVNNANARRVRAFRAGLVRAVALVHAAFVSARQASAAEVGAAEGVAGPSGRPDQDSSAAAAAGAQGAPKTRRPGRRKGSSSGVWEVLVEGAWHPEFDLQGTKLETVREAVRKAEEELAAKRGSGSGDEVADAGAWPAMHVHPIEYPQGSYNLDSEFACIELHDMPDEQP